MKKYLSFLFYPSILMIICISGCHKSNFILPDERPPIVKNYEHTYIPASTPWLQKTGIYLNKGDTFSIIVSGKARTYKFQKYWDGPSASLLLYIGDTPFGRDGMNTIYESPFSGEIAFIVRDGVINWKTKRPERPDYYKDNQGGFNVDIIVWDRKDYVEIAGFFETLVKKDPDNKLLAHFFRIANSFREIQLAEKETASQVSETHKQLSELKEAINKEPDNSENISLSEASIKNQRISELEEKLAQLTTTLDQLIEMKKKLEKEQQKTMILTKELEEKEQKEKAVLVELRQASTSPPVIVIVSPKENMKVQSPFVNLSGAVVDNKGLKQLHIYLNDKHLENSAARGLRITKQSYPKSVNFNEKIHLINGENNIKIRAIDSDGLLSEKFIKIHKIKIQRKIWAVVIGINDYQNIRKLKYAVNDANSFYNHLALVNKIPSENIILLLDKEATLKKVRSTLGTYLKNKASREDMVIIYFAGHGATEKDATSPDGDGLEKYILPYDVDPNDLFATALPMGEISRIFQRIQSDRLIFIADSCYSGASGGRTLGLTDIRTNISDAYLDRIASGKGKVILTASGANEVSSEKDNLQHGVFTYYLLEGIKGRADTDQDGLITVDEAYMYVSKMVPDATNQEQHPIKKGNVEGQLILSINRTD